MGDGFSNPDETGCSCLFVSSLEMSRLLDACAKGTRSIPYSRSLMLIDYMGSMCISVDARPGSYRSDMRATCVEYTVPRFSPIVLTRRTLASIER